MVFSGRNLLFDHFVKKKSCNTKNRKQRFLFGKRCQNFPPPADAHQLTRRSTVAHRPKCNCASGGVRGVCQLSMSLFQALMTLKWL